MRTYEEINADTKDWLAEHANDHSSQRDHAKCIKCDQNTQLLRGRPVRHRASGAWCPGSAS